MTEEADVTRGGDAHRFMQPATYGQAPAATYTPSSSQSYGYATPVQYGGAQYATTATPGAAQYPATAEAAGHNPWQAWLQHSQPSAPLPIGGMQAMHQATVQGRSAAEVQPLPVLQGRPTAEAQPRVSPMAMRVPQRDPRDAYQTIPIMDTGSNAAVSSPAQPVPTTTPLYPNNPIIQMAIMDVPGGGGGPAVPPPGMPGFQVPGQQNPGMLAGAQQGGLAPGVNPNVVPPGGANAGAVGGAAMAPRDEIDAIGQRLRHLLAQVDDRGAGQQAGQLDITFVDPTHRVPPRFPEAAMNYLTKRRIMEKCPQFNGMGSWTSYKEKYENFSKEQGLDRTPWLRKVVLFKAMTGKAEEQARFSSPYWVPFNDLTFDAYLMHLQNIFWSQASMDQADLLFRRYKQETDSQPPQYYANKKFTLFCEAGYSMKDRDWEDFIVEVARGLINPQLASDLMDQHPKPPGMIELLAFLSTRATQLMKKG